MMQRCPKCDSDDIRIFDREVYITHKDDTCHPVKLLGCKRCNTLFTSLTKSQPSNESAETIDKIQSAFGKLSKGCNKILENIK